MGCPERIPLETLHLHIDVCNFNPTRQVITHKLNCKLIFLETSNDSSFIRNIYTIILTQMWHLCFNIFTAHVL